MFTADRAAAMETPFLFVDDIDTAGKRCLVRFDLNVPLVDGAVSDDTRIRRVLPGLNALIETGARLVILTHLGRPKGQQVPDMSVAPVAAALAALLGRPVPVVADITGAAARDAVAAMQDGDIVMLENLRFQAGRRPMIRHLPHSLPRLVISMSVTPFPVHIGHMPLSRRYHG